MDVVHGSALVSYSAAISGSEKGEQWQRALALLGEMREAKLEPDAISYSAGAIACDKGGQWQQALSMLKTMRSRKVDVDFCTYGTAATMCEQGGRWIQVLSLLAEMRCRLFGQAVRSSCIAAPSACDMGEQW